MSSSQYWPVAGSGREPAATILIIEDTPDGRQALQTLLAGQGYTLAFAENGPEGLAQAIALVPDLILLDVMLPGMDGLEVCRQLRANPLVAEVPIIMITALDDHQTRLQGIIAGADDFISKKFDGTELRARVRTITRLNRYRRLMRERAKFERLVELLPSGLLLADAQGIVRLVNPAMLRMLGADQPKMVQGKEVRLWVEPGQWEQWSTSLRRAATDAAYSTQFEATCLRKDGSLFPVEVDIGHFVGDEQLMAYFVIRDITGRRRLQEQLLQSHKMESIGRLAGGIAHDFNNLLTTIMGYVELTLNTLPADALEQRENQITVSKAARSAANLTRQLLAFARRQPIEPSVFNPNRLLLDLNKFLRRLIGEDIDLLMQPAPDLGLIRADPSQIEQVLVNLVVNARDAMPEGGKLTIETANVILDKEYARLHAGVAPGLYVMIVVSDTGIGMDETTKQHIFEPFFTTKEVGQGTGLGLATCYGIVKQHGGSIEIYSELGHGTTFKIYLPRVDAVSETYGQPEEVIETILPHGTETILVVEDENGVRSLITRALSDLGYTILEAANGDEALEVIQAHTGSPIKLLLTDIVMPKLGGKSLAERLTGLYPGLKILFTSGYTERGIVQYGQLESGVAFLPKPFTTAGLARKVREVLE